MTKGVIALKDSMPKYPQTNTSLNDFHRCTSPLQHRDRKNLEERPAVFTSDFGVSYGSISVISPNAPRQGGGFAASDCMRLFGQLAIVLVEQPSISACMNEQNAIVFKCPILCIVE